MFLYLDCTWQIMVVTMDNNDNNNIDDEGNQNLVSCYHHIFLYILYDSFLSDGNDRGVDDNEL